MIKNDILKCGYLLLILKIFCSSEGWAGDQWGIFENQKTIGEGAEIEVDLPQYVSLSSAGDIFVLNSGDCSIRVFDQEWTLLRKFGRCGDGPGELSRARSLFFKGDELWVVRGAQIIQFDNLTGEHINTIRGPWGVVDESILSGDLFVSSSINSLGQVTVSDVSSLTLLWEYQFDAPFLSVERCHDGVAIVIDKMNGLVYRIANDGQVETIRDLELSVGDLENDIKKKELPVIGHVAIDPEDGYFLMATEDQNKNRPLLLRKYNNDFSEYDYWALPNKRSIMKIQITPNGKMMLIDKWQSAIEVCGR